MRGFSLNLGHEMDAFNSVATIINLFHELEPAQRFSVGALRRVARARARNVPVLGPTKTQHPTGAQSEALFRSQHRQRKM
jgi:hypothetical protein